MGELLVPVLMLLVAGGFYREAGRLRLEDGYPMNSATYPKILAGMLALCAVYLLVRFCLKRKKYIAEERARIFDFRVLATFGLFLLFYFTLPYLGYIPSAVIFLVLLSLFFQKGRPRLPDTVVLPVCLSVGLYVIFGFMSIYLPVGELFEAFF